MATARTPTSLIQESCGSMTFWIAPFAAIDEDDTYASGQTTRIVAAWCNPTDVPTGATYEGIDVNYTYSTGAITFEAGENARVGTLYMLTSSDGLNS
jgi:hypothetical protein